MIETREKVEKTAVLTLRPGQLSPLHRSYLFKLPLRLRWLNSYYLFLWYRGCNFPCVCVYVCTRCKNRNFHYFLMKNLHKVYFNNISRYFFLNVFSKKPLKNRVFRDFSTCIMWHQMKGNFIANWTVKEIY